jgi:hypothetical protein
MNCVASVEINNINQSKMLETIILLYTKQLGEHFKKDSKQLRKELLMECNLNYICQQEGYSFCIVASLVHTYNLRNQFSAIIIIEYTLIIDPRFTWNSVE